MRRLGSFRERIPDRDRLCILEPVVALPSAEDSLMLLTVDTAIFAALDFNDPAFSAAEDIWVYMYNRSGQLQKGKDHANQVARAGFDRVREGRYTQGTEGSED